MIESQGDDSRTKKPEREQLLKNTIFIKMVRVQCCQAC